MQVSSYRSSRSLRSAVVELELLEALCIILSSWCSECINVETVQTHQPVQYECVKLKCPGQIPLFKLGSEQC